jgi:hypothetical protein
MFSFLKKSIMLPFWLRVLIGISLFIHLSYCTFFIATMPSGPPPEIMKKNRIKADKEAYELEKKKELWKERELK